VSTGLSSLRAAILGPPGYVCSEYCTGDESMAAPRVKLSLASTGHEIGQVASTVF